jgi:hypothetical protein
MRATTVTSTPMSPLDRTTVSSRHRTTRRWAAVALATVVVTFGMAACSSGDEDASPTTTVAEDFNVDVSVLPGTDTAAEGARADVTDDTCENRDGTWVASGTVTNSADGPRSYRIYAGFVDPSGETRAVVEAAVSDLQPGDSQQWESSAPLGGVDDVRCVLRVERVLPNP